MWIVYLATTTLAFVGFMYQKEVVKIFHVVYCRHYHGTQKVKDFIKGTPTKFWFYLALGLVIFWGVFGFGHWIYSSQNMFGSLGARTQEASSVLRK